MNDSAKYIIQFVIILLSGGLLLKIFAVQVISDDFSKGGSRKEVEYPYRGTITDRHGELIVYNSPVYDLMVVYKEAQIHDTTRFCTLFDIEREQLDQALQKARKNRLLPTLVREKIYNREFARFQDHLVDFPGFYVQARTVREYSSPALANALGYIGEISKNQLERDTADYYQSGDFIGITGLESSYEEYLRGRRGLKVKVVNANQVVQGSYQEGKLDIPAIPGTNLVSTIDLDLQQYAEYLLENKTGSIIALEPATGEILAMASGPSYDPNLLTGRNFSQNYAQLRIDTLKPLFNRPIMADVYPPGSIFKLLQSLIALEEGVIEPYTRFTCNRDLIGCHGPHSYEDLNGAIMHSCNPYFYQTFRRIINNTEEQDPFVAAPIGMEKWRQYLLSFGLGRTLGIDIPNEKPGIIPKTDLYDGIYGKGRWKFSNVFSLSIGQGELGVSPLQMANFATIIANRGYYITPHLIKSIGDQGPLPEYEEKHFALVSGEHYEPVVEAMADVVKSGTGQYRAKLPDIEVCGKTGTVQNPHGEDHSVFIAFAPKENPQIAVSVYVENGGQGARSAAAIAGLLIEKYIKQEEALLRQEDYVRKGEFIY